jgi:hypothetical protein
MAALAWVIQAEASQAGSKIGVPYAEAFRYSRFHPTIENLITTQSGE